MVSDGRKFDRALARRRPSRKPRPRLLVVCEGVVTEPNYFNQFRQDARARLVEVRVDGAGADPSVLVERAIALRTEADRDARRQRDSYLKFDEVWCVFDVDDHHRLQEALATANENHIRVALSNPCFELWVLLHFQEQSAFLTRGEARAGCQKHLPHYDKDVPFADLVPNYEQAVRRSRALHARTSEISGANGNPSTLVHTLTERILELGREAHLGSR